MEGCGTVLVVAIALVLESRREWGGMDNAPVDADKGNSGISLDDDDDANDAAAVALGTSESGCGISGRTAMVRTGASKSNLCTHSKFSRFHTRIDASIEDEKNMFGSGFSANAVTTRM